MRPASTRLPIDLCAEGLPPAIESGGPLRVRRIGKKDPTLVFLHGLGRVANGFAWVLEALLQEGFAGTLLWIDNPGLGANTSIAPPLTTDAHAQLHLETLEALALKDRALHLIGLSFGAMIATKLATELPNVQSLTALAPSALETALWRVTPASIWANLRASLPGQPRGEAAYLPFTTHPHTRERWPQLVQELRRMQRAAGGVRPFAPLRQLLAASSFRLRPLKEQLPPQRCVWVGDQDRLVPERNAIRYAALINAPLITVPRCGHDLSFDAPLALARGLRAFLAGATSAELQALVTTAQSEDR